MRNNNSHSLQKWNVQASEYYFENKMEFLWKFSLEVFSEKSSVDMVIRWNVVLGKWDTLWLHTILFFNMIFQLTRLILFN